MSELNQRGSLRQLPPGKLSDIKKIFEDAESTSGNKGDKPIPPARPPPPPTKVLSPVPLQQAAFKITATKQNTQQHHMSAAIGDAELALRLRSQDSPSGPDKVNRTSNQIQQAKKISCAITNRFAASNERNSGDESVILDNPLYSSIQEKTDIVTDVSDLYAKVNKPQMEAEASPRKVSFSSEGKIELGMHRRVAIKISETERRKTIAGIETGNEEPESCSVNVAQRTKFFDGSKDDKPTIPQKLDSVVRKFSMRTPKEFEEEHQNKLHSIHKNDNELKGDSLYEPPWDLSKNSALDKLKKTQFPPTGLPQLPPTKCDNISSPAKSAPLSKPPVRNVTSPKQVLPSHKLPNSDIDSVAMKSTIKAKPPEVTPEPSPQRKVAPPPKPPRTHAHDDYIRVKVSASQNCEAKSSSVVGPSQTEARKTVHLMNTTDWDGGQEETEHLSVKDRISKMQQQTESISSEPPPLPSSRNTEHSTAMRNHAPSRPPPPKRRPSSGDHQRFPGNHHEDGPVIVPVSPRGHPLLGMHLSAEVRGRRPSDQLPPEPQIGAPVQRFPLRKSYSSECLHSSRGSSLNGELDDADDSRVMSQSSYGNQYEAVIDPEGYAVPNVFIRLPGKKRPSIKDDNVDVSANQFLTRIEGFSGDAFSNKNENSHGNWTPATQEQSLDKVNKKKMNMVKQKINQAYADVSSYCGPLSGTVDGDGQLADQEQNLSESVIESTELRKRIDYCTSVRLKSMKNIEHSNVNLSAIYPQLFEYCLVVGLQQLVDTTGYQPYIIHKFPENVSSNLSVPNFCFPDAALFKPGSTTPTSESYSFVMTYSDGTRVYGYCRRIQPSDTSLPEVICIISPIDAFNMYNTLLSEIETRRRVSLEHAAEMIAASFGRPLPRAGRVCHIRTLNIDGDMETIFLERPSDNRLQNVNYESPLHYLGTDRLVKVFSSMLMERRIILCSNNLSVLTQTVHALSALLYPFQWQHVYIPLLPHEMLDVLCAPVPFIVGVMTAFLPRVLKLDLDEVFVVDLDKKNIVKSQGDEANILPKRVQKALRTAINMCKIDAEAQNVQWLMVAEAFLRMFIETVGHFNNHICTQQDGNRMFQKERFIQEVASKEVREFLYWFTETQMFEVFSVNHLGKTDYGTSDLFMQRLTEYRESKEESGKNKGLGAKVKNFGKALKTKLQAS